jgi:hypothetical protein
MWHRAMLAGRRSRRGGDGAKRGNVSRCGEEDSGGAECRHARRMRRGVPRTAIASMRTQSNVASERARRYDRSAVMRETLVFSIPVDVAASSQTLRGVIY